MEIKGGKLLKKNFILLGLSCVFFIIAFIALKIHFSKSEVKNINDLMPTEEFINLIPSQENNSDKTAKIKGQDIKDKSEFDLFNKKQFIALKNYISDTAAARGQIMPEDDVIPPAVENIYAIDPGIGGRLDIFWDNPENLKIKKIRIYRFEDPEGAGKLIGEADNSVENHTDKGLIDGQLYYYIIKSVNDDNKESGNTEKISAKPNNLIPPACPSDIKIKQQGGNIELSWTNPSDEDLAYIYIYRSEDKSLLGTLAQPLEAEPGQKLKWTDNDVTAYKNYFYSLAAVDTAGNISPRNIIKLGNPDLFISPDKETN